MNIKKEVENNLDTDLMYKMKNKNQSSQGER